MSLLSFFLKFPVVLATSIGSSSLVEELGLCVLSTIPDELLRGTSNRAIVRALRAVASASAIVFACGSRAKDIDGLYQAGATYVYMPSSETANGVFAAGLAAMTGKLDDYRATREAACGPVQTRLDVERMSS